MSDTDLTKVERNRKNTLFRGTISVCVVYAIISLLILMIIHFTDKGKIFIEEKNFPFAIAFAIGMLIIISLLVYKVVTFKFHSVNEDKYDSMMCPDFWTLQETSADILNNYAPEDQINREYTCVKQGASTGLTNVQVNKNSTDKYERQLATNAANIYGQSSFVPGNDNMMSIQCNTLYPQLMAQIDMQLNPDIQNALRCTYAQKCGLPWSSVCPDMS